MGDDRASEIHPDIFDRTGASILFERAVDNPDVPETLRQPLVFNGGKPPVCFLLRFGREITAKPAKVRAVGIAGIVRFRVMNAMRDHIALLAKGNRVGPQEKSREPNAAKLECLMRTEAMEPKGVVNSSDKARDEQGGGDRGDGKMRGQKPEENSETR